MRFGGPEILLIVIALVLLFGASRLPQLARSLGQSRKAFKEGLRDAEDGDTIGPQVIDTGSAANDASALSDEEILAEMQRRAQSKS